MALSARKNRLSILVSEKKMNGSQLHYSIARSNPDFYNYISTIAIKTTNHSAVSLCGIVSSFQKLALAAKFQEEIVNKLSDFFTESVSKQLFEQPCIRINVPDAMYQSLKIALL